MRLPARLPPHVVFGVVLPLAVAAAIFAAGANRAAFLEMQRLSHVIPAAVFTTFWQSATFAGDGLAAAVLAALFLWWRADVACACLIAAAPLGVFQNGLRALVPELRPPAVFGPNEITIIGPELRFNSFPSGHTATAAAFAAMVFFATRNRWLRALALVGALTVAESRAAVGVHWPIDIAVGFAGGWLCAWVAWQFAGNLPWTEQPQTRIVVSVVFLVCAVVLVPHVMALPLATPFRYTLVAIGGISAAAALARAARDWRDGRRDAVSAASLAPRRPVAPPGGTATQRATHGWLPTTERSDDAAPVSRDGPQT